MSDTFDPTQDKTQGDAEQVKADQTQEHDAVEAKADEILDGPSPEDEMKGNAVP